MITQDEPELLIGRPHFEPTMVQELVEAAVGKFTGQSPMKRRPELIKVRPMTGQTILTSGGQFSHTPPIARSKRAATLVCLISLFSPIVLRPGPSVIILVIWNISVVAPPRCNAR